MNLKRITRCTAALALAIAIGAQPALAGSYKLSVPSGYTSPFVDVQKGDWYYNYVAVLNSKVGDTIDAPGGRKCVLAAVRPLSEAIIAELDA